MSNTGLARAVVIANVTMTNADTEYSYTIPEDCTKITFKLRSQSVPLKFCFTALGSGTTYVTLPPNASETLDGIKLNGKVLYFQAATAAQVLEVQVFKN